MIKRNLIMSKAMALDLKVPDLANELGIHPSTLSLKLNGKTEFTVAEVDKIKEVLKLNRDEVIDIFFD